MHPKKRLQMLLIALALFVAFTVFSVLFIFVFHRKAKVYPVDLDNITWYDKSKDEFVLSSTQELYEFAALVNQWDFKGQTVKLGSDITVNEGEATEWSESAPKYLWIPAGKTEVDDKVNYFAGVFDGQGYTISGLYCVGEKELGLFAGCTTDSLITNLQIKNSYFCATGSEAEANSGSIAGCMNGRMQAVYSNAIVESKGGSFVGGLVGAIEEQKISDGKYSLLNCWFDGTVITYGDTAGGIVGLVKSKDFLMSNCLNSGSITAHEEGCHIAGLCAWIPNKSNVAMEDCLNVGKITGEYNRKTNGSVIGAVDNKDTKLILTNIYSTIESYDNTKSAAYSSAIGSLESEDSLVGDAVLLKELKITGISGYRNTSLNFDKYWGVITEDVNGHDGTPVLKKFMDKVGTIPKGAKRAIVASTEWYDSSKNTHTIRTKEQLYGLVELTITSSMVGKTFLLGNDIVINEGEAEEWVETAPDYKWIPIGRPDVDAGEKGTGTSTFRAFAGTFDGQGYTISGLYCVGYRDLGLFAAVTEAGTVKNLRLTNSYFCSMRTTASANTGSIAGLAQGTFESIYSDAIVESKGGSDVGGFFGMINAYTGGKIRKISLNNCWFDGQVKTVGLQAGGFIGRKGNPDIEMTNCLNTGSVIGQGSGAKFIGGLLGRARYDGSVSIVDCLNAGLVDNIDTDSVETTYGSVVGYIDNVEVIVKMENTYAAYSSFDKSVGYYLKTAESKNTVMDDTRILVEKNLLGEKAKENTKLDFENYWVCVKNPEYYPILKTFQDVTIEDEVKIETSSFGVTPDISWYSDAQKVFTIRNVEELYGFIVLAAKDDFAGKTVKLGADIVINKGDASKWSATKGPAIKWIPIGRSEVDPGEKGTGTTVYKSFAGTFDGQGHSISGLYCVGYRDLGLFASVEATGVVKNVRLTNSYFVSLRTDGTINMGSFAGIAQGKFETLYSDAIIECKGGIDIGGIVGVSNPRSKAKKDILYVKNSWFNGKINSGGGHIGGIVGAKNVSDLVIENCMNSGSLTGTKTDSKMIGGIVGRIKNTGQVSVSDCLNVGKISNSASNSVISTYGSIIGYIDNIDLTVNVKKTYAAYSCFDKAIGYYLKTGAKVVVKDETRIFPDTKLTGNSASKNTTFDYKKMWVLGSDVDEYPILKSFRDISYIGNPQKDIDVDISWYTNAGTVFEIGTTDELYGLAVLAAKDDFVGKTILLTRDIVVNTGTASEWSETVGPTRKWIPIGRSEVGPGEKGTGTATYKAFAGTFDGQGHSISGLYCVGYRDLGLFAVVANSATIKNARLLNSYFCSVRVKDSANVGSFAGLAQGTFDSLYSEAIIETKGGVATGGIVGLVNPHTKVKVSGLTINNCWFNGVAKAYGENLGGIVGQKGVSPLTISNCMNSGEILGLGSNTKMVGGLIGHVRYEGDVTIHNCLNVGEVSNSLYPNTESTYGSIIGYVYNVNVSVNVTDTYSSYGCCDRNIGYYNTAADALCKVNNHTETMVNSLLLGNNAKEYTALNFETIWTVVTEPDGYPVLTSFKDVKLPDPISDTQTDISWYQESKTEFTLNTIGELYGFALLSGTNDFAGKTIKLGRDLALNEGNVEEWLKDSSNLRLWIPIGRKDLGNNTNLKAFAGTFDGQGFTISGVYCVGYRDLGLFAAISKDGVVQNLKVKNSYFSSIRTSATANVGSIAGLAQGTFTNVYSSAVVDSKGGTDTGGLIGVASAVTGATIDKITMRGCWFNGSVQAVGTNIGGIIGRKGDPNVELTNCYNAGTVTALGEVTQVGGLIGHVRYAGTVTIDHCLNVGRVSNTNYPTKESSYGSIIGYIYNVAVEVTITDTYGLTDSHKNTVGYYTTSKDALLTVQNGASTIESEDLMGSMADEKTVLDFPNTWLCITEPEGLPVLTYFKDERAVYQQSDTKTDTTWYDETKSEFELTTVGQFYGFSELSKTYDFAGKTIKLGSDITVNTGNAADWATNASGVRSWTPIGTVKPFKGTFKGMKHTISGLYAVGEGNQGLFAKVGAGAVIEQFTLTNSYFYNQNSTNDLYYAGGVAAVGVGTYRSIYIDSSVTVKSASRALGGLIGVVKDTDSITSCTITDCVFAGTVDGGQRVGGFVGEVTNKETLELNYCYLLGTIKATKYSGGFVGNAVTQASVNLLNCLSNGKVNCTSVSGSVIGRVETTANTGVITKTFATNECNTKTVGADNNNLVSKDITVVTKTNLTNENVSENALGLVDNIHWVNDNGTLKLKCFMAQ